MLEIAVAEEEFQEFQRFLREQNRPIGEAERPYPLNRLQLNVRCLAVPPVQKVDQVKLLKDLSIN